MDKANAYGLRRQAVVPTISLGNGTQVPRQPRPRCRLAHGSGQGSSLSLEQVNLLGSRLRIASLILATTMTLFFVRNLIGSADTCAKLGMSVALCGAMMAFTGVLATLLWARRDWCGPYLRMIEIA